MLDLIRLKFDFDIDSDNGKIQTLHCACGN